MRVGWGAELTCCLQEKKNTDESETDKTVRWKERKGGRNGEQGVDERKQGEVMAAVKGR